MPRSANQKTKLLHLLQIFFYDSDEDHPLTVPALVEKLEEKGISAERKSIYNDIETLQQMDFDIQLRRGKGYFLGERIFQLAELKLLVDAVQSSKFIPARKSSQLIEKLEQLTSRHLAQGLQRQVFVAGRVKTMNDRVYYNIDTIHQAISHNRQITFQYFKYDRERNKAFRHGGRIYQVSPFTLLRSDENYYLIAYDALSEEIRHYRVDKMTQVTCDRRRRSGIEAYQSFDLGEYTRIHFGMFRGREADVLLRCENRMADILIDRFGDQISMAPDGADHFTCTVRLAVSTQFFGWLFGLGDGIRIVGPDWVVEELREQMKRIGGLYE